MAKSETTHPRWTKIAAVPSETHPTKVYTISQDRQGRLGCNCPSFIYGKSRVCKHLAARMTEKIIYLPAPKTVLVFVAKPSDLIAA